MDDEQHKSVSDSAQTGTAVILVGGGSRRMGRNKAFLDIDGQPFLERQIDVLKKSFSEILISASCPDEYTRFNLPVITDIYPRRGPLAGIYTGLINSSSLYTFILACDMPFVETGLIRHMETFTGKGEEGGAYDVIVPHNGARYEPLHAFYSKGCIPPIKEHIEADILKIAEVYPKVNVKAVRISTANTNRREGQRSPLTNLNTMAEYNSKLS